MLPLTVVKQMIALPWFVRRLILPVRPEALMAVLLPVGDLNDISVFCVAQTCLCLAVLHSSRGEVPKLFGAGLADVGRT